jgi:ATP-dependent DNA ligase
MLARAELALPRGQGWRYEPKWDGFRALIHVGATSVRICGRNGGALEGGFPEIVQAIRASAEPGTVFDGELVVFRDGRLDFSSLMRGPRERPPATFIGFDLLRSGGRDQRARPFSERRSLLERSLPDDDLTCVTTQTSDIDVADAWFDELAPVGLEGVVAKSADGLYRSGKRGWIKVRRFDTLDVVVGGFRGTADGASSLLLGLFDNDGTFRYIGQTTSLPERQRARVAQVLETLSSDRSFSGDVMPGMARWENARFDDWIPVEPVLVCEVSYSRMDHGFLRHAARIVRWRPDKDARDCTVRR